MHSASQLIDQVVNGVTLGMLYILVALGLNIILGLMGVINFSHGAFFMLGAYLMYQLNGAIGFWPAIIVSAVLVGLLGMAFESTLVRPLYKRIPEYTLLLTFGTALIFAQIVRKVWGDDAVRVSTPSYMPDSISIGAYQLPFYKDVLLVGLTILILTGVWLLLNKTNIGHDHSRRHARRRDGEDPRDQHAADVHAGVRDRLADGGARGRAGGADLRDPAEPGVAVDRAHVRDRDRRRDRLVLGRDRRRAADRHPLEPHGAASGRRPSR